MKTTITIQHTPWHHNFTLALLLELAAPLAYMRVDGEPWALLPVETNKLLLVGVSSQPAAGDHGVRTGLVQALGKQQQHKNFVSSRAS